MILSTGTRSTLPSWTHEVSNGNMNFLIQFHDPSDLRGAVNAMMRLIEVHGLPELQRVGIFSQGSSTSDQLQQRILSWLTMA